MNQHHRHCRTSSGRFPVVSPRLISVAAIAVSSTLAFGSAPAAGQSHAGSNKDTQKPTSTVETPAVNSTVWDNLARETRDRDWKVRWNAVNELGKLKDPRAVPALVGRAMYDDNPHPRWRSLWALKSVDARGSETIPLLRAELENDDRIVVRNAAIALAFFASPEGRAELLHGLEDSDPYRRWEAIFSLRKIGDANVAKALIPLLDHEREREVRIRNEVALALGNMGGAEVISSLLAAVSGDKSPQVRWRAAMSLAKVGDASVIEHLERALGTEADPQVRKHIVGALANIAKRRGKY